MQYSLGDTTQHFFTLEEYFALEQIGEKKFEYWEGKIICVNATQKDHYFISNNTIWALSRQLINPDYRVFSGKLAIKTPVLPPLRHPDLSVIYKEMAFERLYDIDVLTNPLLVAEVTTPVIPAEARRQKRLAYLAIPTLMEYLQIEQELPHVTQYSRQGDSWQRRDFGDLNAVIELSFGGQLWLSEIYEEITFD